MKEKPPKNLSERDRKHLWHPLTQHKLHPSNIGLVKARGTLLYDELGSTYIDGIASWYTCMYGHCNPYILKQVSSQMRQLDQVVFSGFTHEPAIGLAEELIEILPGNQQKLFFSDNGSTAVEVALKMALQFHFNRGEKRPVLLALDGGFHGDTFGAMSVSGISAYNGPFRDLFLRVERIPLPREENIEQILADLKSLLRRESIAAFIYEPLVQGAAGMKMYPAACLDPILEFLKAHGVLTIADEVMTGFGKTGAYFASDHLHTKPDMMCLSKALTAGLMPMAVTSCTQAIFDAFYSDDLAKGLFHGHTYTANPLACTAARAGITLLRSEAIQLNIRAIMAAHVDFNSRISGHPRLADTRQCGVIYALDLREEMERYGDLRNRLYAHFLAEGVFLRPLGNTIYILPPYTIKSTELGKIYDSILSALDKF